MLNALRRSRRSIFGLFIIAICSVLMLGFGLGSFGNQGNNNVAAKVGDHEISYAKYASRHRLLSERMRSQLGQAFDRFKDQLNLEQQSIDALVSQEVFNNFYKEVGFTAGVKQIEQRISLMPFFLENGLNQDTFNSFLRGTGLTMAGLQQETKREIVSEQLTKLLADMSSVSDIELKSIFESDKTEASFKYVSFANADFENKVNTQDTETLQAFFDENAERFREPAKVKFDFVKFHPTNYRSSVDVTEEDLEITYLEMKQEGKFNLPAEIKLRQIMLKKLDTPEEGSPLGDLIEGEAQVKDVEVSSANPNQAIKAKLESILGRIEAGETFEALAREFSEDAATKEKGGDLGWMTYQGLDPKLAKAAADLDIGEFSEVIELPKGYYTILVEEAKDERVRTLEEVKTQVDGTIRANLSPEYAYAEADQSYEAWAASGKSIKEFAEEKKLELVSIEDFVDENEVAKTNVAGLSKKVIEFGPETKEIVELNGTAVLFQTTEYKESDIPKFETVREKVKSFYTQDQKGIIAKEAAEKFLARANELLESGDKQAIYTAASELGLELQSTEKATRQTASGDIFAPAGARQSLFTLDQARPLAQDVIETPTAYYVAAFSEKGIAETADFEKEKTTLLSSEANATRSRLYSSLEKSLQSEEEIWIDPELFSNSQ